MKCVTLSEEVIDWKLVSKPRKNASKAHKNTVQAIQQMFPGMVFYEECKLPLGKGQPSLYVDIFIPTFCLMIEVDGCQHDKYNQFFHKNLMNFIKQKHNDRIKEEWCELNQIKLLRIKDATDLEQCRLQISSALPQRKAR